MPKEEKKIGEGKAGPGRPPGAASKRSVADLLKIEDVMKAKDYDPIASLIDLARKEGTPFDEQKAIHLAILPYRYSKQPERIAAEGDGDDSGARGGIILALKL